MARSLKKFGRPTLGFLGTLLISSCAEMQIDVDVYKGPLANHEDVQTEQLAAMAVGTKPLLLRLKKSLKDDDSDNKDSLDDLRRLVLATLTLFDDRGGQLSPLIDSGEREYEKYILAVGILDSKELSESVSKKLVEIESAREEEFIGRLAKAYLKFSGPGNPRNGTLRDSGGIFTVLNEYRLGNLDKSDRYFLKLNFDGLLKNNEKGKNKISLIYNKIYVILSKRKFLEEQAELLFPGEENAELRGMFVDDVSGVARSFLDARESLDRLLSLTLRGILAVDSIEFDADLGDAKKLIIEKLAAVVARLIRPHYLRIAIDNPKGGQSAEVLRNLLKDIADDNLKDVANSNFNKFNDWKENSLTGINENFELVISKAIEKNHVAMAIALAEQHKALRGRFFSPVGHSPADLGWLITTFKKVPESRRYGLADGPVDSEQVGLTDLYNELVTTIKTGLPFDRGRLLSGLNRLVEDYLRTEGLPDRGKSRKILVMALVRFSEKLLFIANHEALFKDLINLNDQDTVKKYVQVLQAVGNTIQIQANEQIRRADRTGLLNSPEAKETLDSLIAALHKAHIEATENPDGSKGNATNILAALKVAYDQRAGMAYIRPASAYLRSSYASSTLQNDPGLSWRNLLARHSYRSIPFFGECIANDCFDDRERKRQEINKEIDKQFWQTINRVRVAGAGDTNYAIAKDDIGNWYVKSFSTKVDDIVNSMRDMALFNVGAALDTDILGRLDGDGQGQKPDATKTSMGRLFEEYKSDYDSATARDLELLRTDIVGDGLKTRIEAAWAGIEDYDTSAINNDLGVEAGVLKTAYAAVESSNSTSSTWILGGLREMLRFHIRLEQKLRADFKSTNNGLASRIEASETKYAMQEVVVKNQLESLNEAHRGLNNADATVNTVLQAQPFVPAAHTAAVKNREANKATVDEQQKNFDTETNKLRPLEVQLTTDRKALADAEIAQASALVTLESAVRTRLTGIVERRKQAVREFESSIIFIGKAIRPAPAEVDASNSAQAQKTVVTAGDAGAPPTGVERELLQD